MEQHTNAGRNTIERSLERYDMTEFGDWLESAWTEDGSERRSLRELRDEFNKRVLRARLEAKGLTPSTADIETTYEVLTDEEASGAEYVRTRRELEQVEIQPDDVTDEFVTHQTIHNYLTDVRGADFDEPSYTDQLERNIETLERLQARTNLVTENTIDRMCDADREVEEKYNILVDVRVVCRFCGEQYQAVELVEQGGCPCDQ
jgi:hypothetical protein